mmetsp:Transcript_94061/g.269284  ORF Transcript_94061/g.269284 Transcript_94061/m.269284 type:complete len:113 (+) Transcript_94061:227-565(+)
MDRDSLGSSGSGGKGAWEEEYSAHPVPPFSIDSPVIQHLLASWTADGQKLRYVSLWLTVLVSDKPVPNTFPSGLQLVGLKTEIKDGFLTLIVPMLRQRHPGNKMMVHTRRER